MLSKFIVVMFGVLAWCLTSDVTFAAEPSPKEEAVAMVKRVQEKFKKDGPEATFKAVMDKTTGEFHDRELYPFIYDLNGINVAHGARPALVGKNLISLKDQDGKYLMKEMIEIAKGPGSGWMHYMFPNPFTGTVQQKSTYVERMGDYLVGVGIWYEGSSVSRP
jgi:cytochrome c